MDFAPAGMEMWGYSADILTFDLATLSERLVTQAPRLRFSDERIWTLVKLLARSECCAPMPYRSLSPSERS